MPREQNLVGILRDSPSLVVVIVVWAAAAVLVGPWSLVITAAAFLLLYGPWRDRLEAMTARNREKGGDHDPA